MILNMLNKLQLILRSVLFYFLYAIMTLVVSSLAFISKPFLPFHIHFLLISSWSRFSVFAAKYCCGIQFHVTGLENLPTDQPYVVLAKHQSQWETYFLMYLLCPVSIICKKELIKLPFFGYCLSQLKPIPIDRENPKQALRDIQTLGLERLQKDKMPVLIFPEGTRTEIGAKGKYARGGAALAIKADVPIICISHNAGYFWPSGQFHKTPGLIEVHISAPINPEGKTARELTLQAEEWIESHIVIPAHNDKPEA